MIKRIIIGLLIIIILIVLFSDFSNGTVNNTKISTLLRQSARWAIASLQDDSPMISLLHANYAAGYLWALRDIYSDVEIINTTGIDFLMFQKKIRNIQDNATKKVSKLCPNFVNNLDKYLLKIGGDI